MPNGRLTFRQRELVGALVEQIKPLLAGRPPEMQGAVLADLLAIWLAGHVYRGHPKATNEMRANLLEMHVAEVRRLVEINAKMLGTTP